MRREHHAGVVARFRQIAPLVRHFDPERQTVAEPGDRLLQLEQGQRSLGYVLVDHLAAGQADEQLGHVGRRRGVLARISRTMVDQPRGVQAQPLGSGVRAVHADRVEEHQGGDIVAFLNHQPRQLAGRQSLTHPRLQHATAVGPVRGPNLEPSFCIQLAAVLLGQDLDEQGQLEQARGGEGLARGGGRVPLGAELPPGPAAADAPLRGGEMRGHASGSSRPVVSRSMIAAIAPSRLLPRARMISQSAATDVYGPM